MWTSTRGRFGRDTAEVGPKEGLWTVHDCGNVIPGSQTEVGVAWRLEFSSHVQRKIVPRIICGLTSSGILSMGTLGELTVPVEVGPYECPLKSLLEIFLGSSQGKTKFRSTSQTFYESCRGKTTGSIENKDHGNLRTKSRFDMRSSSTFYFPFLFCGL